MEHLRSQGKSPSTIRVHRACICKTILQAVEVDLNESTTLADYLKNLDRECPKETLRFPRWDLCVVLRGLRLAPFEPLATVDVKYLTLKTLFLTALASAARVSELGALSAEEGFIRVKDDKSEVVLRPFDGFLAKNQRSSEAPREYTVRALRDHVPVDDPERLLCPVRALSTYLRRTNKFRGARKKLFISYMPGRTQEIGVQSIARWLRDVIKLTYELQSADVLVQELQTNAHEIRAIASSLAVWRNTSVQDVLQTAYWKNHNTFTDFYLRKLCYSTRKLEKRGGAVVCAGRELCLKL